MTSIFKLQNFSLIVGSIASLIFLTGMGEIPSSDVKLRNNNPAVNGLPGSTPYRIESTAVYNDILNALPIRFDCDLNGKNVVNESICSVCNCYHEARGESAEGQVLVQRVVYTREMVHNYPNSVCGVIRQPYQFSWLNPGARQPTQQLNISMAGVRKCMQSIADAAQYKGKWFASNYHADYVSPRWRSGCRSPRQIGAHIFYTGGCDGVRPPTNFPNQRSQQGVAWSEILFSFPKAFAKVEPLEAFTKKNPQFKLKSDFSEDVEKLLGEKTNPAVVKGDFNGDGVEDTVAILIKDKKHYMVFFVSNGTTFKMVSREIMDFNAAYLTTIAKNRVKAGLPNSKARDLVQLEVYLGPTEAFFIEKNKVVQFRGKLN